MEPVDIGDLKEKFKEELEHRLADVPLDLSWTSQGKIWWNEDWLRLHGPVRERIPGFDDHISFANFDLRHNKLPQIELAADGRPFVRCLAPVSEAELKEISRKAAFVTATPEKSDTQQYEQFMKTRVYERLAAVASIRNIVRFHGFQPSKRTLGLDYLDRLLPAQDPQRVDM